MQHHFLTSALVMVMEQSRVWPVSSLHHRTTGQAREGRETNTEMQRLLSFMIALRRLPPLSELTGDEERLLFELRQLWEKQGSLSVADVYDLSGRKSASTAYRQLVALKDKGLLHVEVSEDDRRRREVTFTAEAENLFAALG